MKLPLQAVYHHLYFKESIWKKIAWHLSLFLSTNIQEESVQNEADEHSRKSSEQMAILDEFYS